MDSEQHALAALAVSGLGVIHKNMTISAQADEVALNATFDSADFPNAAVDAEGHLLVAGAVGVTNDTVDRKLWLKQELMHCAGFRMDSEGVLRKVSEEVDFP